MKKRIWKNIYIFVIPIMLLMNVSFLYSQSLWLDNGIKRSISVELLYPEFNSTNTYRFSGQVIFITLNFKTNNDNYLILELPYLKTEYREYHWFDYRPSQWITEREEAIGNLYIGYKGFIKNKTKFLEFGIRLPLIDSKNINAKAAGVFADVDRFDAFVQNYASIKAMINLSPVINNDLRFRLRFGPIIYFNIDQIIESPLYHIIDNDEIMVYASGQLWYEKYGLTLGGGLSFVSIYTEDNLIDNGKSTYQIGFSAGYSIYNFKPGIQFRLPLEVDLKDVIDYTLGFSLQILLKDK